MPLPLVPIAIAVGALMFMRSRKSKNGDAGGGAPEPVTYSLNLEELRETPEFRFRVGDTLLVDLPNNPPNIWKVYTEAVQGEPVIVWEEEDLPPPEPEPGSYGTHRFSIVAHEPGNLTADFALLTQDEAQTLDSAPTLIIIS